MKLSCRLSFNRHDNVARCFTYSFVRFWPCLFRSLLYVPIIGQVDANKDGVIDLAEFAIRIPFDISDAVVDALRRADRKLQVVKHMETYFNCESASDCVPATEACLPPSLPHARCDWSLLSVNLAPFFCRLCAATQSVAGQDSQLYDLLVGCACSRCCSYCKIVAWRTLAALFRWFLF